MAVDEEPAARRRERTPRCTRASRTGAWIVYIGGIGTRSIRSRGRFEGRGRTFETRCRFGTTMRSPQHRRPGRARACARGRAAATEELARLHRTSRRSWRPSAGEPSRRFSEAAWGRRYIADLLTCSQQRVSQSAGPGRVKTNPRGSGSVPMPHPDPTPFITAFNAWDRNDLDLTPAAVRETSVRCLPDMPRELMAMLPEPHRSFMRDACGPEYESLTFGEAANHHWLRPDCGYASRCGRDCGGARSAGAGCPVLRRAGLSRSSKSTGTIPVATS